MKHFLLTLCCLALAVPPISAQMMGFPFRPRLALPVAPLAAPRPAQLQAARQLALVRAITPVPPALAAYWQQPGPPVVPALGVARPGQLQAARQLALVRAITPVPPALAAYWQQPDQPIAPANGATSGQLQAARQLALVRAITPGSPFLPLPATTIPAADSVDASSSTMFGNASTPLTGMSRDNPSLTCSGTSCTSFKTVSRISRVRARVNLSAPSNAELNSGLAMNFLLDEVTRTRTKQVSSVTSPLTGDVLRRLVVTKARSSGSISLLGNGDFNWPTALSRLIPESEQAKIQQQVRTLRDLARQGQSDMELFWALKASVSKSTGQLQAKVNDIPMEQYLEGKRFLSSFAAGINAIGNGELGPTVELQDFARDDRDVSELIDFMLGRGLRFAPAGAQDAAAYLTVYNALAEYAAPTAAASARLP